MHNLAQFIMATVVLVIAGLFLVFAYSIGGVGQVEGYPVTASFGDVGGLSTDGDVLLSGVRVGSVTDVRIDPQSEQAVVRLSIRRDIRLPVDSAVAIRSKGVTGGTYVELQPGDSKEMIAPSGRITKVSNYQPLEIAVGNFVFSGLGGQAH